MTKKILLFFLIVVAYAKPVKVDEILTDKNELKLDIGISYYQTTATESGVANISYQTLGGDFVSVPTFVGSSEENIDYIGYSAGVRYGLTKKVVLAVAINAYSQWSRSFIAGKEREEYEKELRSLSTALSYEVFKEDAYPALLVGVSSNALERVRFSEDETRDFSFKNFSLFAISYYTVDPVVFLIQIGYQKSYKKEHHSIAIENGDIVSLAPQIYFAVNPYTSINWGWEWMHRDSSLYNDVMAEAAKSSIAYMMGVTYELSSRATLVLDAKEQSGGSYDQSAVDISYSYRF